MIARTYDEKELTTAQPSFPAHLVKNKIQRNHRHQESSTSMYGCAAFGQVHYTRVCTRSSRHHRPLYHPYIHQSRRPSSPTRSPTMIPKRQQSKKYNVMKSHDIHSVPFDPHHLPRSNPREKSHNPGQRKSFDTGWENIQPLP